MLNWLIKSTRLFRQLQDECEILEVEVVREREVRVGEVARLETTVAALTDALNRERELHAVTRADCDEFKAAYVEKCEYIAMVSGKPSFKITEETEPIPATNRRLTPAQITEQQQERYESEFMEWAMKNPDEYRKAFQQPAQ